jgi:hypothetical protein
MSPPGPRARRLAGVPRLARLALAVAVSAGLTLLGGAGPVGASGTAPASTAPGASGGQLPVVSYAVSGPVPTMRSGKWSGYFVTDAGRTTNFTAVSASWRVAPVTCTGSGKQWNGLWVGMDGWWNNIVEQGGTEAICAGGRPQYQAWWEMFPANQMQGSFPVTPGDQIRASVTYAPASRTFTIVVADQTSGAALRKVTRCQRGQDGCPRTSAEVISEDVRNFSTGQLYPLPDYGTQPVTSVAVTDTAGHTGPLDDPGWELGRITDTRSGATRQVASALGPDGSSFATRWVHQ